MHQASTDVGDQLGILGAVVLFWHLVHGFLHAHSRQAGGEAKRRAQRNGQGMSCRGESVRQSHLACREAAAARLNTSQG